MGDSSFGFFLTIVPVVFFLLALVSLGLVFIVIRTRRRSVRIVLGIWLIILAFLGFFTPLMSAALSLFLSPILGILGLGLLISAWRLTKNEKIHA
jgi:hypothetical protein